MRYLHCIVDSSSRFPFHSADTHRQTNTQTYRRHWLLPARVINQTFKSLPESFIVPASLYNCSLEIALHRRPTLRSSHSISSTLLPISPEVRLLAAVSGGGGGAASATLITSFDVERRTSSGATEDVPVGPEKRTHMSRERRANGPVRIHDGGGLETPLRRMMRMGRLNDRVLLILRLHRVDLLWTCSLIFHSFLFSNKGPKGLLQVATKYEVALTML